MHTIVCLIIRAGILYLVLVFYLNKSSRLSRSLARSFALLVVAIEAIWKMTFASSAVCVFVFSLSLLPSLFLARTRSRARIGNCNYVIQKREGESKNEASLLCLIHSFVRSFCSRSLLLSSSLARVALTRARAFVCVCVCSFKFVIYNDTHTQS